MTSVPDLHVRVQTPENEQFQGQCVDLDSSQDELVALVKFEAERAPAIALGDTAQVAFRGAGLLSFIESEATTVLRTDEGTRRCYSFRLATVSKDLLLLVANRRGAPRIRPQASDPVRVRVLNVTDGVSSEAMVHDISSTGLSILVERDLERQLRHHAQLCLAIRPPSQESIEIMAMIRHRRLVGSSVLLGLEFDGRLPDFMHAQERLLSFIANLK